MHNGKVMMAAYGGGHMRMLQPVIEVFENLYHDVQLIVLALTSAGPQLSGRFFHTRVVGLRDYLPLFGDVEGEVLRYGRELLPENHNPASGVWEEESVAYLGLSMWDLVCSVGGEEAKRRYDELGRHAFQPENVMDRILKSEMPDVFVATTSPRMEYAALRVCNKLKIPTIQLVDTFADFYPLPVGQDIVVMSEQVAERIAEKVTKNQRVHPFGQPVFDQLIDDVEKVDEDMARSKVGLPQDGRVLLFTAKRLILHDERQKVTAELDPDLLNIPMFSILRKLARERDLRVIVRPHPNDPLGMYRKYFEGDDRFFEIAPRDQDLSEALKIATYVLTYFSTVGIEAAICGKTVFTFKHEWPTFAPPEFQRDPFIYSEGFKELERNLYRVTDRHLCRRSRPFYERAGSALRIAELIVARAGLCPEKYRV